MKRLCSRIAALLVLGSLAAGDVGVVRGVLLRHDGQLIISGAFGGEKSKSRAVANGDVRLDVKKMMALRGIVDGKALRETWLSLLEKGKKRLADGQKVGVRRTKQQACSGHGKPPSASSGRGAEAWPGDESTEAAEGPATAPVLRTVTPYLSSPATLEDESLPLRSTNPPSGAEYAVVFGH